MKSNFFILSILLHMAVFMGFSKTPNNSLKNGENSPNININLTMSALGNSSKTLAKMTTKKEKNIADKSKEIKKKINPKKQVVQKKEEIIRSKSKIVQSNKTKPEKIIKPTDPGYTESDKNSEIEVVRNTSANDTILGNQENDKNLIKIQNGQYALKNQKVSGINIVIHKEIPPSYPDLALKMGYEKETLVKVKFLVDKKGRVGDVQFYTSSKYGFEDEVKKALKQWVFEPILYQDKPMPIYFYKVFHFVSKS